MSTQTSVIIKLINVIKSLKKLSESEYESEQCLEYLKKIDNSFNEEKQSRSEIAKIMIEYGYTDVALKCLKFYTRKNFFENEQTWPCTFYLLRSIWNYSDILDEIALASTGFIPILLEFLSSECLLPSEEEEEKLLKLTLNILNNIAHQPETKIIFQQNQASKILKKMSNIESEHLRVLVYVILAQIINENEFDKLNDPSSEVVENLVIYIKDSLKKDHRYKGISTSEYMNSLAKLAVIKENKQKVLDTGVLSIFKAVLSNANSPNEELNHALICIWSLCFDEKICEVIKKDKDLISIITNIKITSPSDELQRRSAGILFTINDLLRKMTIPKIGSSSSDTPVKKSASAGNHIMISYNWSSKENCVQIKDELKTRGFQVWIDVEQIYGSSLTAMAEAIENASVVLMCVSEKYYLSPHSRLEAEYAAKLQKPIIPLIMQPDYTPVGWLGAIIGGKIYYKFGGKPLVFEPTFSSMLKEINRYIDDSASLRTKDRRPPLPTNGTSSNGNGNCEMIGMVNGTSKQNGSSNGVDAAVKPASVVNGNKTMTSKPTNEWTNREVRQWVNSLNLSPWILDTDLFENINGSLLRELNEMRKSAPEFFYNLMKAKLTSHNTPVPLAANARVSVGLNNEAQQIFHLSDLLKLSHELNELFKK